MNNQEIPGDSWRQKHVNVKLHAMNEVLLSGIHVDCEVFGLFSDLLPESQTMGESQSSRHSRLLSFCPTHLMVLCQALQN